MAVSMTNDEFIKKACSIHNNLYDYSHVNYSGINVKVKIGCSIHGIFEQSPKHHLNGSMVYQNIPSSQYLRHIKKYSYYIESSANI